MWGENVKASSPHVSVTLDHVHEPSCFSGITRFLYVHDPLNFSRIWFYAITIDNIEKVWNYAQTKSTFFTLDDQVGLFDYMETEI